MKRKLPTRKLLLAFILLTPVVLFLFLKSLSSKNNLENQVLNLQSSNSNKDVIDSSFFDISLAKDIFRVNLAKVELIDNLTLLPNFENKLTAVDAKENNNCQNLVNAGFYTPEDKPIGLFLSGENILSRATKNRLFNGFFFITNDGRAKISPVVPNSNVRLALQAGPILIREKSSQSIHEKNKKSRRVIVAVSEKGEVYFFAIYNKSSLYLGPYLSDLPEILNKVQEKLNINLDSALNLDGGAASAFYTDSVSLSEATHAGSYFCFK